MRIRSLTAPLVVLALTAIGMPAASAGTPTTDMMISKWDPETQNEVGTIGDDIKTNDPSTQRKTLRVKAGKVARYVVSLQNEGDNGPFTCAFLSDPPKLNAIAIFADDDGPDTTDQWNGAGFSPALLPGEVQDYHFRMKVPKNADRGDSFVYSFGCTSSISLTQDSVSAKVKVRG